MYTPDETTCLVVWWVVRVTLSYWAEEPEALDVIAFFNSYFFCSVRVEVSSFDDQPEDQSRALVSSSRGTPYQAFRGYGRGRGAEDGHA